MALKGESKTLREFVVLLLVDAIVVDASSMISWEMEMISSLLVLHVVWIRRSPSVPPMIVFFVDFFGVMHHILQYISTFVCLCL